jgi:hypothetical protein
MDLVGLAEIAEMAGVSRQAVTNWTARHDSFPQPLARLAAGPVWQRAAVAAWLETQGLGSDKPRARFRKGAIHTHADLIEAFGGEVKGGIFLPTREGRIVCGCITTEMNPEAPECILIGDKPRVVARAEKMADQGGAIPIFVKRGINQWEYRGMYDFVRLSREPRDFRQLAAEAGREDVVAALYFRRSGHA